MVDRAAALSISLRASDPGSKTTVDVHDYGTAETVEHWNDNVDVKIKHDPIRVKGPLNSSAGSDD